METAEVLVYWKTPTAEIKLVKDKEGKVALFMDDGLQFHEDSERRYHEALFTVPAHMVEGDNLSVLVLGGGDGLGVRNLLELPFIGEITLVDISPEIISLAFWDYHLTRLNRGSLRSDKVKVVIGDAYEKVKEFAKEGKKFDLIILDYPDVPPVLNHQIARLYREDHLNKVKELLAEGGVVSVQIGSFSVLPTYSAFVSKVMQKVFGKGFVARVILKGFPDGAFYYSKAELVRKLPNECFIEDLSEIKIKLYRDEKAQIRKNLRYVRDVTEAVLADFRKLNSLGG